MKDNYDITALHFAAQNISSKCLNILLKHTDSSMIDIQDSMMCTPLHWASASASEENIKLLISRNANILITDNMGKTPLHWSASNEKGTSSTCIQTLMLAASSSVNWQDYDGITALHLAIMNNLQDAVQKILSMKQCNVDIKDNQYRTALHWAAAR